MTDNKRLEGDSHAASEDRDRLHASHESPKQHASDEDSQDQSAEPQAVDEVDEATSCRCRQKFRLKLALWNALALEDAQRLWSSADSEEVWTHYGYDVRSLQEAWYAHVIEWVQINLACGVRSKETMKRYRKFVARTERLFERCKEEKRHDDLAATLANMSSLFEPGSTTSPQEVQRILCDEREAESALFYLLRERPDLLEG